MLQDIIVISIVVGALAWLGRYAWRFMRPKAGGGCPGGCNCGAGDEPVTSETARPATKPQRRPEVMISADDLRARVKARQS